MVSVVFAFAALATGRTLSESLWSWQGRRRALELEPLERAASAATLALAAVTAASYALGLTHALSRWTLLATTAVFLSVGVPPIVRWVRAHRGAEMLFGADAAVVGLALLPVALFVVYTLCRVEQMFVLSHDGLAYHMPRAAMIARSGYVFGVDGPDLRMVSWPANYEILLADVLALDGSDELSGWVSTAAFVAFLVAAAAMAQRWWGRGPHGVAVAVALAAMPVAILHAGAHKNDLMTSALILVAAHFAARWAVEDGIANFVLMWVSGTMAVSTKLTGIFLAAALVPLVVAKVAAMWRAGKRPGADLWRVIVPLLVGSVLTLGPMVYLHNLLTIGKLFGQVTPAAESGWSDFGNLWRFPYMAFTVPFSTVDNGVWVPWDHRYWFWPTSDLSFSTFGALCSIALLGLPWGLFRFARNGAPPRGRERLIASAVLTATFLMVLPVSLRPVGFFAAYVRYTIFFPPVILLWTLAPAVRALAQRGEKGRGLAYAATLAAAAYFAQEAVRLSITDVYAPFGALVEVIRHPELRRRVWAFPGRAASIADQLAGPDDSMAFEGSDDAWSYPLFGADLRRHVTYLHSDRKDFRIPEDARWIVIDRAWHVWFGHPGFKTFGDWSNCIGRGKPTDDDLKVYRLLVHDPRYALVYHLRQFNQAVFRRVDPAEPAAAAPAASD